MDIPLELMRLWPEKLVRRKTCESLVDCRRSQPTSLQYRNGRLS
jgi:hypothetical protein